MSEFVDFLKRDTRACFVGGRAAHFGDPEKELETAQATGSKCPLHSSGIICFTGSDAHSFVNGQFTTDCRQITDEHSQFSGWCDAKGRVLFLFTLYTDGERLYAILPKAQIDRFMRRLHLYILRADVQLEDLSGSTALFGLTGSAGAGNEDASGLLRSGDTVQRPDRTVIVRHGPGPPRFVIIGPDATAVERWTALELPAVGEDSWTTLEIYNGLPHLEQRTSGQFLPQNLNLDALDGLSFSKGCYPGQEIIARLKYRGAVKKRLLAATLESPAEPEPGAPIRTNDSDRIVGQILNAQRLDSARIALSAVVEIDAAVEDLLVAGAGRPSLRRIDLPYAVD